MFLLAPLGLLPSPICQAPDLNPPLRLMRQGVFGLGGGIVFSPLMVGDGWVGEGDLALALKEVDPDQPASLPDTLKHNTAGAGHPPSSHGRHHPDHAAVHHRSLHCRVCTGVCVGGG